MRLSITLPVLCLLPCLLFARVGETQKQIEKRLVDAKKGIAYRPELVESKIKHNSVPYRGMLQFLPSNVEHVIYWKPDDGSRPTASDVKNDNPNRPQFPKGWDLHVVYWKGYSVFECYRRNGAHFSNAERDMLLNLLQGQSKWVAVSKEERPERVLDYQWQLENTSIRADHKGAFLLMFAAEIDEMVLAERTKVWSENAEKAKQTAPTSVDGF